MAEIVGFQIAGLDAVRGKLLGLSAGMEDAVANALEAEAEIEMTEAKRRTPVLTGVLRASGHVQPVKRSGREISVVLAFGGPAAPYAVYVHENLEAFHKNGQAKFLESVILESAPHLANRIAERVRKGLGGGA
jgi:predicted GTPase